MYVESYEPFHSVHTLVENIPAGYEGIYMRASKPCVAVPPLLTEQSLAPTHVLSRMTFLVFLEEVKTPPAYLEVP